MVLLQRLNQGLELWMLILKHPFFFTDTVLDERLSNASFPIVFSITSSRLESGNKRKGYHKFYKKIGFVQYALSLKKAIE